MASTRKVGKVSKTRARSYRRRGRVSPCKNKGPAVCRSLSSCKYSSGKKRSFCRRVKNSARKSRSHGKTLRSGKSYGGSRMSMGGRRRSRRAGSRMSMGGRRRSRRAGSRKRRAGTFGILEQAIVPGSLLLANNYYKSKRSGSKRHRRGRRSRRSRRN